ncbi:MAG TPA: triose-phosphate isomerase [Gemmatimonadaceae bacterium]|nr:triose-phosphate isomerase [Gemmatimonadaceae bacterium]
MRTPILAANWKMNHGPSQARAFMQAFMADYAPRGDRSVLIFPSALAFSAVRDACGERRDIGLGVQNIGTEAKGAFTGENSAPIAKDAGAEYVLVGHSERRHVFGETDEQTAAKCAIAFAHGLVPMLCVGETLAQREAGTTGDVVVRQLRAGLSLLGDAERRRVLVAYEPVWAIGTGRTATPDDASAVHAVLRSELQALGARADTPILYGGSVNDTNAQALLSAPGVDGLLVGGASLDPASWHRIVMAHAGT